MNHLTPPRPGDPIGFADCLTEPGELTIDEAIRAMSLHHACPRQCRVLDRAVRTLDGRFVVAAPLHDRSSDAAPTGRSAVRTFSPDRTAELDQRLADRIRDYQRLAAESSQDPKPTA